MAPRSRRCCALCGTQLALATAYCDQCGVPVPVDARVAFASPERVWWPGLHLSRLSGTERRVCSVLFVDLVGFTPFSQDRDPEDVRELLLRYFDAVRTVVVALWRSRRTVHWGRCGRDLGGTTGSRERC